MVVYGERWRVKSLGCVVDHLLPQFDLHAIGIEDPGKLAIPLIGYAQHLHIARLQNFHKTIEVFDPEIDHTPPRHRV